MLDLVDQDYGNSRPISFCQGGVSLDIYFARCYGQLGLELRGDAVDDIAQMASVTGEDSDMNSVRHRYRDSGQREESVAGRISCEEGVCQEEVHSCAALLTRRKRR